MYEMKKYYEQFRIQMKQKLVNLKIQELKQFKMKQQGTTLPGFKQYDKAIVIKKV